MLSLPAPAGIEALSEEIMSRHGDAVLAILFYGSCRRKRDAGDGLVDLLVLVESYRAVHRARPMALANRLLPPNVYYLERCEPLQEEAQNQAQWRYRSKYAVITLSAFERRCQQGLDAYFWARFAQPAQLAFSRSDKITARIAHARANAAARFVLSGAGLCRGEMDAQSFWVQSLQASYRCELRPERPQVAFELVEADRLYYAELSERLMPKLPFVAQLSAERYSFSPGLARRVLTQLEWFVRRVWGRLLNLARLFKAAGTFTNGMDYVVWKIERHSGVRIEPTEFMRRHPRLATFGLAWKTWRQGVLNSKKSLP